MATSIALFAFRSVGCPRYPNADGGAPSVWKGDVAGNGDVTFDKKLRPGFFVGTSVPRQRKGGRDSDDGDLVFGTHKGNASKPSLTLKASEGTSFLFPYRLWSVNGDWVRRNAFFDTSSPSIDPLEFCPPVYSAPAMNSQQLAPGVSPSQALRELVRNVVADPMPKRWDSTYDIASASTLPKDEHFARYEVIPAVFGKVPAVAISPNWFTKRPLGAGKTARCVVVLRCTPFLPEHEAAIPEPRHERGTGAIPIGEGGNIGNFGSWSILPQRLRGFHGPFVDELLKQRRPGLVLGPQAVKILRDELTRRYGQ